MLYVLRRLNKNKKNEYNDDEDDENPLDLLKEIRINRKEEDNEEDKDVNLTKMNLIVKLIMKKIKMRILQINSEKKIKKNEENEEKIFIINKIFPYFFK